MTALTDLGTLVSCRRCGRIVLATPDGRLLNPPNRLKNRLSRAVGLGHHLRQGFGFGIGWHECDPSEHVGLRYQELQPLRREAT